MGSMTRFVTWTLSASLALTAAAAPLAAQGKGKAGGGGEDKERAHAGHTMTRARDKGRPAQRAQAPEQEARGRSDIRGSAKAQERRVAVPPGEGRRNERAGVRADLNDARRETRSDEKIQRRFEREFAGDVEPGLARGRGRFVRAVTVNDLTPSLRRFYIADRLPAQVAVGAVARAHLRGLGDDDLIIAPADDRVFIRNRNGAVLVDLDERRVRDMGRWDVVPLSDGVKDGAPSFCRSGAGHPVWGRQWCLDKGFGLGYDRDVRWGRTTRVADIVFRRVSPTGSLVGDALLGVIGQVAFDRLALHAITLGLSEPLSGRWMGEPTGARVLMLTSGSRPVAEIVDLDRDDRADVMLVTLKHY